MVRRAKFRNFSGGLHLKKVSWGKGFLRLIVLVALIATLGLVASPVAPVSAGGWYNSDWLYRQEVTISHARIGATTDLTDDVGSGTIKIFVEYDELFSKGDSVLLVDDLNSELLTVDKVVSGAVVVTASLAHSYTVANHACLKNETNPGSDLVDFPVLVQITNLTNAIFGHAQADGDDILFTESNGTTKLSHEIDYYDRTTKELDAWVKVPSLSASDDTTLYMYYGNVDPNCPNQEDAENVWSEDYVMVQHLQETTRGGGTFDDHLDSTSNHNDGELFAGKSITGQKIDISIESTATLDHVPCDYPEPTVYTVGEPGTFKWTYTYYYDWTIVDDEFTATEGGDMDPPSTKDYNLCYSYLLDDPLDNIGANMTAIGKIAGADEFDGIDDAIDFYKTEDGGVWNISEAITISAWVNLQWRARLGPWEFDNPDYAVVSSGTGYEMCLWTDIEGEPDPVEFVPDGWFQIEGNQYDCCPDPSYPNIPVLIDQWYLLTVVYDGTDMYSYVNSDLDWGPMPTDPAGGGLIDGELNDGLWVGMCSDVNAPLFGIMDEVRVLNVGRDGEWVKACYNNQAYPDVFYSLGDEEEEGAPPTLMEGDPTLDKHVSMADAMFTAQGVVGLVTLNADQLKCADTSDDGSVSMADAMHIAQWVVDPTGSLGVLIVPLWKSPADDDMLPPEPL